MDSVVTTAAGRLRGTTSGGVTAFLGVPYAAPPVGPGLYAAPAPVEPWEGTRDATALAPTPPQRPYPAPFAALLHNPVDIGPDFLSVNVWTPGPGPDARLPVMVWIPGGAFLRGSNAIPTYDGTAFARDGVVLVSVSYRLGAPGFAVLPDAPDNRGLLDQIAALEWVRDNIAAFGGDPDSVTIFGESAGAMSVLSLLTSPAATGLFRRAIAQSGSARIAGAREDLSLPTAAMAKHLGVEATAAAFASVDLDRMLDAQFETANSMRQQPDPAIWGRTTVVNGGGMMPFFPVLDDTVVPQVPESALAAGVGSDVDLLIGTTTDEFRFFLVPPGLAALIDADGLAALAAQYGWSNALVEGYSANRPDAAPGDVFATLVTDSYFRMPSLRAADAHASRGGNTFAYEFAWSTTHLDLRACHALELPFVFDNLAAKGADTMIGPDPAPQPLADAMHAAWVAFARAGDPGWQSYDTAKRAVQVFDHPAVGVQLDPRGDERQLWP
ncbi:carboxylesterase/lipase family protein [Luteipulveratus mongoliensis]|uniref:Carboxylic ester hydrolase n=1 Tax=Luteipulveratus mongoliensis TaxID=571913 RepID=A0A0K1JEC8_9MICO|nr:carboxylesterase family protein [Luteipulveratus mongoliensis]AKU15059.1 carboxylesterase [Luteipulveratus mongoliensis]